MPLTIQITTAGRAAIVNAENTGTAPVTVTQIGLSATAHTPAAGDTALPGELKRIGAVSGLVVAPDTIHVSVADTTTDAYNLRSFALYLNDGTLFAIYGQADPILVKVAASVAALSVDVAFADIAASSITFGNALFVNPPASESTAGVAELATLAEAQAGADLLRILTPGRAKAAVLGWLLSQDGAGSTLDADLLDGQHGAYYANIPARLGYTPLDATLFTAAGILTRLVTVDGTGSGLDADMLDGHHAASFPRLTASSNAENGGYRIYSDGYRECWGKLLLPANAQGYHIDFPAECQFTAFSNVVVSAATAGTDQKDNPPGVTGTDITGFTVYSAMPAVTMWWQAKGY